MTGFLVLRLKMVLGIVGDFWMMIGLGAVPVFEVGLELLWAIAWFNFTAVWVGFDLAKGRVWGWVWLDENGRMAAGLRLDRRLAARSIYQVERPSPGNGLGSALDA